MLFSTYTRTDHRIIQANESDFAFFDRCAWSQVEQIRSLLEQCLSNYPRTEQPEVIARLRSGDERHFISASFELLLHEYLIRQGFSLMPHPELPNGSAKHPDFLVTCPDGHKFYLEAVCATEDDGRHTSTEALKNSTLDYINSKPHHNFVLSIDSYGDPLTQPSGKKLYADIKPWLDSLDPDAVLAEMTLNGYSSLPERFWSHEEWEVTIRAIPLEAKYRGTHEQMIGIRGNGATWIDSWTPIRNAIQNKTNRYGQLNFPLVVAVNVTSFKLNPIDEMQALFGQEQFTFSSNSLEAPHFSRAANGAWIGPKGPRGKQCSGAWLCDKLTVNSLAKFGHTLYINPWANLSLPESMLVMPYSQVEEDQIKKTDGVSFREAFGLDLNWPD